MGNRTWLCKHRGDMHTRAQQHPPQACVFCHSAVIGPSAATSACVSAGRCSVVLTLSWTMPQLLSLGCGCGCARFVCHVCSLLWCWSCGSGHHLQRSVRFGLQPLCLYSVVSGSAEHVNTTIARHIPSLTVLTATTLLQHAF